MSTVYIYYVYKSTPMHVYILLYYISMNFYVI